MNAVEQESATTKQRAVKLKPYVEGGMAQQDVIRMLSRALSLCMLLMLLLLSSLLHSSCAVEESFAPNPPQLDMKSTHELFSRWWHENAPKVPIDTESSDGAAAGDRKQKDITHNKSAHNLRNLGARISDIIGAQLRHVLGSSKKVPGAVLQTRRATQTTDTSTEDILDGRMSDEDGAIDNVIHRNASLHATPEAFMVIKSRPPLDSDDILIGTWIYLDPHEVGTVEYSEVRTVFSNKILGCQPAIGRYGIAMYINSWHMQDDRLHVEFGSKETGCHKINSKLSLIKAQRWTHVAVHCTRHVLTLYIDGEPVNSMEFPTARELQYLNSMAVGAFDDSGNYPLYGNISDFAILHNSGNHGVGRDVTVKYLLDEKSVGSTTGLVALYRMRDATERRHKSLARDEKKHRSGLYHFPKRVSRLRHYGVRIPLVSGLDDDRVVTDDMMLESDNIARQRREAVKDGMRHAWQGYKKYAWGRDEIRPVSNKGSDNWGGRGVTLVDSLDTLWIMGLKDEFYEAMDWVQHSLSFNKTTSVSVFETTIRELGGLLSAYDLSSEATFLEKAELLADKLMPAFDTESGIPVKEVNFRTDNGGICWSGGTAILAELGSLQVEFRYLAHKTKRGNFEYKAMKPMQLLNALSPNDGLFPVRVNHRDGSFADHQYTFGALADSFYEYLLKIWLQGGRHEGWLREMYDRAINGLIDKLLMASDPTGLAFIGNWNGRSHDRKMDEMACFMPGTMALGAYTDPLGINSSRARRDMAVAKALMFTCREMFNRTTTGVAPEFVEFPLRKDIVPPRSAPYYMLRPETVESLFYLHHITKDPIYRQWAWEIWIAIDSTCRTKSAYGSIRNVSARNGGGIDDRMESFFLAETMKYLFMVLDPDSDFEILDYVFNTEGHPLRVFDSTHQPVPPYTSYYCEGYFCSNDK